MSGQASSYTVVLSHDVDHLSLRQYPIFSKIPASFLKQCTWNNLGRLFCHDISFFDYCDGIKWCFLYPLIKFGLAPDPWEKAIWDIVELEKRHGVRSTFFFIPFKDRAGHVTPDKIAPLGRSARYDVRNYKAMIERLTAEGWEVGVHGIDAHVSVESAKEELSVIADLLPPGTAIGIRMHWLYQSSELWGNLFKAGYHYDATFGSNQEVGFPEGHFVPFKKDGIWVIPLNIQDGTLLANWHMGLTLAEAWTRVERLMDEAKKRNAVITVLWHTNAFGVYRYWGDLYEKIIQRAKADDAKIVRCIDVIEGTRSVF